MSRPKEEMAVVNATFYVEAPAEEGAVPASVIVGNGAAGGAAGAVAVECTVPEFPTSKDLPSRELYKAYARQLASMLVSWDEQVSVDVLSIVRDPDIGWLRLTQWKTPKDRTLGSKVVGSMPAAIIELIDSDLLEEGYGLPIIRDIARTVMMLTDRGLTLKVKQFMEPKPHKQKSTLFRALKQWSNDLTALKKQSQKPTDLVIMSSLELLVSGVKDAQEIVKLMRGQSVISGDDLDHSDVLDILNRESKDWWRESREGKDRAQALLSDPDPDPKSSAKWCFDWVMGGSCPLGSTCPYHHEAKSLGSPTPKQRAVFNRPCQSVKGGKCARIAAGGTCYFQHPEAPAEPPGAPTPNPIISLVNQVQVRSGKALRRARYRARVKDRLRAGSADGGGVGVEKPKPAVASDHSIPQPCDPGPNPSPDPNPNPHPEPSAQSGGPGMVEKAGLASLTLPDPDPTLTPDPMNLLDSPHPQAPTVSEPVSHTGGTLRDPITPITPTSRPRRSGGRPNPPTSRDDPDPDPPRPSLGARGQPTAPLSIPPCTDLQCMCVDPILTLSSPYPHPILTLTRGC